MARKDPRIDAYIANAAPFAQPILKHIRAVVHAGCPDVEETIKWNMPHFDHRGLMCGMAAFKQHCSFGFWREAAGAVPSNGNDREGMGQFGRITSPADLPPRLTLIGYVRKAVELKDASAKAAKPARPKAKAAPVTAPDYLRTVIAKNLAAKATWDRLSNSHRNEYIEWVTDAKRDATRTKRLATTLEWLAAGKPLNWRYEQKPAASVTTTTARRQKRAPEIPSRPSASGRSRK